MNGRERMRRAIEFKGPDRVPIMGAGFIPMTGLDYILLYTVPPMSWQPEEPYCPYVHPLKKSSSYGGASTSC